ncbi:hypothetical protein B4U80_10131 [Leptotrombidium deliense]|uniref:Uncharacterized protein n=1 Tax=Leptotrombidium deliense TaxID=299467 RepID=A0A443SJF9_9ACAR|nr:hypothetical protein B4U80_10131 [Leptotrombidium deliense]
MSLLNGSPRFVSKTRKYSQRRETVSMLRLQ